MTPKPRKKRNFVVGVFTRDVFEQSIDKVDVAISPDNINDDSALAAIALAIKKQVSHQELTLCLNGGHGDIDPEGNLSLLNDLSPESVTKLVKALKAQGLKFKYIVLPSCFSAAAIPYFYDILTDDGIIHAHLLSSTNNADDFLNTIHLCDSDVLATLLNMLIVKITRYNNVYPAMGLQHPPLITDVFYNHADKSMHSINPKDLEQSISSHNQLLGGVPDTKGQFESVMVNLLTSGIVDVIRHGNVKELEKALDNTPKESLILIYPMSKDDFPKIIELDGAIFPDEPRWDEENCANYYHQAISFIAIDKEQAQIKGYLFASLIGETILIGNLGVDVGSQGNGIGSALLKRLIDLTGDCKDIKLQVRSNNTRAIELYQRFGFELSQDYGAPESGFIYMKREFRKKVLVDYEVEAKKEQTVFKPKHDDGASSDLAAAITLDDRKSTDAIDAVTTTKTNYNFYLKCMAGMFAGAALIALAILLLPQVAVISVATTAAYISSGASFVGGASLLGFFACKTYKGVDEEKQDDSRLIY